MSSFHTPEPVSVTIELSLGDVRLTAGDLVDTVVVVNPSDRSRKADVEAAEQTRIDFSNGRLLVKAPRPRGLGSYLGGGRAGSVEVAIELPAGSHIEGVAGFADFRAEGRLGDVRIKTGAGDIRLDQTGPLHLATGAGTITVDRAIGRTQVTGAGEMRFLAIDGDAELKNHTGRISVGEATGAVRARSANGDITVERAHAGATAKTSNGSIRIGEVVRGPVVLETRMGGVDVGIRKGTAAFVDADTRFGRVHNGLEATDGPGPSHETAEIRARTEFGDIGIHPS